MRTCSHTALDDRNMTTFFASPLVCGLLLSRHVYGQEKEKRSAWWRDGTGERKNPCPLEPRTPRGKVNVLGVSPEPA